MLTEWVSKKINQEKNEFGLVNYSEVDEELDLDSGDTKLLIKNIVTSKFNFDVDNEGQSLIRFRYRPIPSRPRRTILSGGLDLNDF